MPDHFDVDVVIGGGGVAGTAAAVALQQLGYHVVLVEPGQNHRRRLAGEVFHPPGVAGLDELGLLPALTIGSIANVNGFTIFSDGSCIRLPYDSVPVHSRAGLCLEHSLIRDRLMKAAGAFPNITIKHDSRVVGIDDRNPSHVLIDVANGGASSRYRCQILIVADGVPSTLSRLAGISVHERRISTIMGYRISATNLPDPDYGSVYLGGKTPILVYPIGNGHARVLFDIPYPSDQRASSAACASLSEAMPAALREEVAQAIAEQPRVSVLTKATIPSSPICGRVVLVGDAGGSCHPLTATGMTMCVSDALLLRQALLERPNDLPAALRLYGERRRWPQATRLLLADALRNAFIGASPEMRVVRRGILSHWRRSSRGRAATLALLSTADGRPLALLGQIFMVMARGLIGHVRSPAYNEGMTVTLAAALVGNLLRNVSQILRTSPRAGAPARRACRLTFSSNNRAIRMPAHPGVAAKPWQAGEIEH